MLAGEFAILPTNWALVANVSTQIVFASARRVALGFYSTDSSARIFPTMVALASSAIRPQLASQGGIWYYLDNSGPLVAIDWYAFSAVDVTVTVLEVIRQGN